MHKRNIDVLNPQVCFPQQQASKLRLVWDLKAVLPTAEADMRHQCGCRLLSVCFQLPLQTLHWLLQNEGHRALALPSLTVSPFRCVTHMVLHIIFAAEPCGVKPLHRCVTYKLLNMLLLAANNIADLLLSVTVLLLITNAVSDTSCRRE